FIHYDDHPDFFENMDSFFENMRKLADEEICLADTGMLTNSFYRLSEHVPHLELQISILKYNDRLHEVEDTAKQIKMDLIEDKIQAEHILISAPDLSQYLPLLVNALKKHEIPFTVSKPYPLTELLPVEHLQLIPDFIHENGDLGVLKHILKSPFYHYHIALAAVPVDELLNSLRISYDLPAMISQLEKAITFDEKESTADEDSETRIGQKKTLLTILKQIREDFQCFDTAFTADDYFKFFTGIFEQQQVVKRIMEWQSILPQHDIADLLGALRAFVDALDIWRDLMNSLTPTPRFGKTHLLEIFRFIISNGHYQPLLLSNPGVHITTLHALDSFEIEKLYMLGMSDANFPRKGGNLLSGLPEPYGENFRESHSFRDKQRFLKILSQTKREIVFSYPIFEDDSPQVGSALLLELNRVAKTPIRNAPSLPIYSAGEILEKLGPDIQSHSETHLNSLSLPVDEDTLNTLRHQLNIQFQRDSHGESGLYDGNLTGIESIPAYLEHYFQQSGYSISALETYAACPMLFYFQRVLGIGEPEEFEDWVTPREKGSLIHQVLFRFYSENPEQERTTAKLIEIATETLRKLPFLPSVLWDIYSEAYLGNQRAGQTGLFPAFLIYEEEQQADSPLRPVYFELPFGRIGRKISHNLPEGFRKPFVMEKNGFVLKMKGVVDRVEMGKKGGILIVDYKTGNYPGWKDIIEGTSLQLPIYLKAIVTLLNRKGENYYPLGAGYYKIKDENNIKKEIIFSQAKLPEEDIKAKKQLPATDITADPGDELTIDSLLDKSIDFAMGYAAGIQRGDFTHTTDWRRCAPGYQRRCPFEAICRINPAKSGHIEQK
ncbi:MAG: PD-(D/E)XK nuclease family protein, partial [Calditrichia bacterium]